MSVNDKTFEGELRKKPSIQRKHTENVDEMSERDKKPLTESTKHKRNKSQANISFKTPRKHRNELESKSIHRTQTVWNFKPAINKIPETMMNAKEYIQVNAFTRLFNESKVINKKKQKTIQSNRNKSKGKFIEFYQRVENYEKRKKENIKRILEKEKAELNRKIIDKRSEEIARTVIGFFERNKLLEEQKNSRQKVLESSTFKPEITEYAKKSKRKTVDELTYGPLRKKQLQIKKLKEEISQSESSFYKPALCKTNKYSNIESRLNLNVNIRKYIEGLNKIKTYRQNIQEKHNKEKLIKEQIECTYKPNINRK